MLKAIGNRLRGERRSANSYRRRLYTRAEIAPVRLLVRRLGIVAFLMCLVFVVFWFDRAGLRDHHDGIVTFLDVVYFTFVTVTTVGYGDIVPVTDRARLIDAILVTPIRLFVLLLFVGTAYELVLQRAMEGYRMRRIRHKLKGHVVICGFGMVGRSAAEEIVARGVDPSTVVAIDTLPDALETAAERGLLGLRGDATDGEVLDDAAITSARAVLICTGRDDTATLACLAVRSVAPNVRIIVAVRNSRQTPLLAQSGANAVISPSGLGGRLMADALGDGGVAEILADLVSARGDVVLRQRPALSEEAGQSPRVVGSEVVLAVRRHERLYWAWEKEAASIQAGDSLVVVSPVDSA